MALPNSGPISLRDVNIELSIIPEGTVSLNDSDVRNLAKKPSGIIKMSDLYGKQAGLNPMDCDYYFDSIDDFSRRIDSIVRSNNYMLSQKSFGFNPNITRLTLSSYFKNTNIQSSPKIIVSQATSINLFQTNSSIRYISETLFDGCPNVTSLSYCFSRCQAIIELPPKLLSNLTNLESITNTFSSCENLTFIPKGFFDNCQNLSEFGYAFSSCYNLTNVPYDLFDKTKKATTFRSCFAYCSNIIDNLPPIWELFPYSEKLYYGTGCTKAPNYFSMPSECQ